MKKKTFIVANHVSEGRMVLAVCDSDIHGKKLEDEKKGAILNLSAKFYSGEEKSLEETEEIIKRAYVINATGKESVALVLKLGLANDEPVKTTAGVPHVQVLVI